MDQADCFVLLDNVQYKKNEWQNRNRIKGPQGPQWLTVPVRFKFPALITEVGINGSDPLATQAITGAQNELREGAALAVIRGIHSAVLWT